MKNEHKKILFIVLSTIIYSITNIYLSKNPFDITRTFIVNCILLNGLSFMISGFLSIFLLKKWGFLEIYYRSHIVALVLGALSIIGNLGIDSDSLEFQSENNKYKEKVSDTNEKTTKKVQDISDKMFSDFLFKISQEINKKCPMVIDKNTRLDNTVAISNKTIQYNYTLVNIEKENIDITVLEKEFIPLLLNDAKTNPGLKTFRDRNVTLSYYYKDKNGDFIFNYKITPELYKG